ncbi:MAG: hypothetical protein AAFQ45_04070 [Pseudomonadota bacterium]
MPIDRVADHLASFDARASGFLRLLRVVKCGLWLVVAAIAVSLGSTWHASTSGTLELAGVGVAATVACFALWRAWIFLRDRRTFSELFRDEVSKRTVFLSPLLWVSKRLGVDVKDVVGRASQSAPQHRTPAPASHTSAPRRPSRVVERC